MARDHVQQHPEEYREDLNPHYGEGQNYGPSVHRTIPAYEIEELNEYLSDLRDDQLKQIPIVAQGERLEQGAVYFDLRHPQDGPIKAIGNMVAGPDNWYVPKSMVDYELWNLLTGVNNPDRLGGLTRQAAGTRK